VLAGASGFATESRTATRSIWPLGRGASGLGGHYCTRGFCGAHGGWSGNQLGDASFEGKLVLRAMWAAQPEATEPQDTLEVGEQHLDAPSLVSGALEGFGPGK